MQIFRLIPGSTLVFCVALCVFSLLQISCFGTAQVARAQEMETVSLVLDANKSYQAGEFRQAASNYQKAIAAGVDNGHMYFNYANSLYRLKQYGRAIANYRRALVQMPGHPDILANLKLARTKVKNKLDISEMSVIGSVLQSFMLNRHLSDFAVKFTLLSGFSLFWLLIAIEPSLRFQKLRGAQITLGVLVLFFALFSLGTRESRLGGRTFALTPAQRSIRPAVIAETEVNIRSGDSESFQTVAVLGDGTEIEIDEQRGDWVEILLPKGRRGWAKKSSLEIL